MTDTVALEPSDLQATPRVGEKVGDLFYCVDRGSVYIQRQETG